MRRRHPPFGGPPGGFTLNICGRATESNRGLRSGDDPGALVMHATATPVAVSDTFQRFSQWIALAPSAGA